MFPQNLTLIPIKEKLPDQNQDVIAWNGICLVAAKYVIRSHVIDCITDNTQEVGMFEIEKYVSQGDRLLVTYWRDITHWMPAKY
jgi:hypothetical protein